MKSSKTVVADEHFEGMRLDSYLAAGLGLFPRSQARIRVDTIIVNGRPAKLATRLCRGDHVVVTYCDPDPLTAIPEKMALSVLHEDASVIVLDKPAGVVTHPGSGNRTGTLLNGVLAHCRCVQEAFPDDPVRPGVVHRLDKDTSGVIIFAKSPEAHLTLARQFASRRVRKRYVAVLDGTPPATIGEVDLPIGRDVHDRTRFAAVAGGKTALTRYRLLGTLAGGRSLVKLTPVTGRTHQLRVHLAALGCPVAGDILYGWGRGEDSTPMLLHAATLCLMLPGEETFQRFRAVLPERFRVEPHVVDCLRQVSPAGGY